MTTVFGGGAPFRIRKEAERPIRPALVVPTVSEELTLAAAAGTAIDMTAAIVSPFGVVGTAIGGSTGGTDIVLPLPAGTATGDVMILFAGQDETGSTGTVDVPSSGGSWTEIGTLQSDTTNELRVFRRTVGGSEPSVTAPFSASAGTPDNFAALIVFTVAANPAAEVDGFDVSVTSHDATFTENATGFTVIGFMISQAAGGAINFDGSIGTPAWTEVLFDNGDGAVDGAMGMIYRANANRGSETAGLTTTETGESWHQGFTIEQV